MQEIWVRSLGRKDPLVKEMATHPSIVAWRIPWMEEPGRLHTVHGVSKSWTCLIDWTKINNSFTCSLFFSFHFTCYSFNIFKTEPWTSLFLSPKHCYFAQAAMETYLRLAGWSKINFFCHGYWRWKSKTKVLEDLVSPEAPLPTLQAATSSLAFTRSFLCMWAFLGSQWVYNFFSV